MNSEQWKKEAEAEAKKQSDSLKESNKHLIDQLTQSKNNALNDLQKQQDNSIYNLNSNKSNINQSTEENAKQANINRLLALKSNQSAMNRAGLGSQGIVGSQVNSINNNYGSNLSDILNKQSDSLRDLDKEKNNTVLTYDTNRSKLEGEYGTNLSNLQSQIDEKALNQYNLVYQQYIAMKQQQWENEQAEKARQEAIRQYNEQMALQRQQMYSRSYGGSSYSSSDGNNSTTQQFNDSSSKNVSSILTLAQQKFGTFSNGYQPKGVIYYTGKSSNNYGAVSKTNKTVKVNGKNQNVWKTSNGMRWIWDGSIRQYVPYQ